MDASECAIIVAILMILLLGMNRSAYCPTQASTDECCHTYLTYLFTADDIETMAKYEGLLTYELIQSLPCVTYLRFSPYASVCSV